MNLTIAPLEAAIAMQSSSSLCRVTSTGPSERSYVFNLTWVTLSIARCGPLGRSQPFPSLHRLKMEVSPNGAQWFLAPRALTLFEQPQIHSMTPLGPGFGPFRAVRRGENDQKVARRARRMVRSSSKCTGIS